VRDRTSRPIAALLAGAVAIGADGLAGRLGMTAWWSTTVLPAVPSARFQVAFHVLVGLLMAVLYTYVVEPALIGRPWLKELIYAASVWILNAIIVLPLIGEGFAGSRHLSAAGMLGFASAHTVFFVPLAVLYEPTRKRLVPPFCDCRRGSSHQGQPHSRYPR
jgi:hypothetical protein